MLARDSWTSARVLLVLLAAALAWTAGCEEGGTRWVSNAEGTVFLFDPVIRIGDDLDFNDHHADHFQISQAQASNYVAQFPVPGNVAYSRAEIRYSVGGCAMANPILLNNVQVGATCGRENRAWTIHECSVNITEDLRVGVNTLEVRCAVYPGDPVTPLDDIEIYHLRIQLVP